MRAPGLVVVLASLAIALGDGSAEWTRRIERARLALAPLRVEDVRRWVERAARPDSIARSLPRSTPRDTLRAIPPLPPLPSDSLPRGFGILAVRPCPARGPFAVEFSLVHRSPASIDVFDLAGRCRVSIPLPAPGSGPQRARIARSRELEPGVYWVRLTQGNLRSARRAVVAR